MVGARQYNKISDGMLITVFYDPSKPKRCYVPENKFRIILTLCFIAEGAIVIWIALWYIS